jgi:hypothetical protein
MTFKAYAVGCKKRTTVTGLSIKKRALPNGNVVTIICGKSAKCNMVCTIVENTKPKPCKKPLVRGRKGGCVSKKSPARFSKKK